MGNDRGYILLLLILLLSFLASAQETNLEMSMEARLEQVLILNIDPNTKIEFGIKKVNDNLYEITKKPDDINFSVESTGNWNLSISSANTYFTDVTDSTKKIPVDFLGYTIENRGNNWDNGIFSHIANRSKDTILPLKPEKTLVLINGRRNNIGGHSRNSFVLRWKFIFEDNLSKMVEFSNLSIQDGYYIDGFYITLSESKTHYKK